MLNTVMALWNQHPGANRQRIVKVIFTFLLISVSIFLLLFTLDGSAWSSFPKKEQIQTKKAALVGVRNHTILATVGETPASANVVMGSTPAAARTLVRICIHTPTVVVIPSAVPQKVEVYAVNNSVEHKMSKPHRVHPKIVRMQKKRRPSRKKSHLKPIATPVPQEDTATILPSPPPATPQPVLTPTVIATVAATPLPIEETPVSSMPDIVTINLTPDVATNNTTDPFVQSVRRKSPLRIPSGTPGARSTKKMPAKKTNRIYEYIECSGSTARKHSLAGAVLKEKRRISLFLGGPLSGIVLFCCCRLARKRKKFANFQQHV